MIVGIMLGILFAILFYFATNGYPWMIGVGVVVLVAAVIIRHIVDRHRLKKESRAALERASKELSLGAPFLGTSRGVWHKSIKMIDLFVSLYCPNIKGLEVTALDEMVLMKIVFISADWDPMFLTDDDVLCTIDDKSEKIIFEPYVSTKELHFVCEEGLPDITATTDNVVDVECELRVVNYKLSCKGTLRIM